MPGAAIRETLFTVAAGICFGLATAVRSNGLLSGIIFACDAVEALTRPSRLIEDRKNATTFVATIAGGIMVAIGFASPQIVALHGILHRREDEAVVLENPTEHIQLGPRPLLGRGLLAILDA